VVAADATPDVAPERVMTELIERQGRALR